MKYYYIILALIFIVPIAYSLPNPSAIYCKGLGYEFKVINESIGVCIINKNITVDSWKFFNGEIATEYGLCAEYNATEIVKNGEPYCIFPNGTKILKYQLMENDTRFKIREGFCGDGVCQFYYEDINTCPQDCHSGSLDMICDGIKDGVCDPDCIKLNETSKDPDCILNKTNEEKIQCNNNSICESMRGENSKNCPTDCHCGNGICEKEYEEESYCKIDCGKPTQITTEGKTKIIAILGILGIAVLAMMFLLVKTKEVDK